jgi:hypothetical protein
LFAKIKVCEFTKSRVLGKTALKKMMAFIHMGMKEVALFSIAITACKMATGDCADFLSNPFLLSALVFCSFFRRMGESAGIAIEAL